MIAGLLALKLAKVKQRNNAGPRGRIDPALLPLKASSRMALSAGQRLGPKPPEAVGIAGLHPMERRKTRGSFSDGGNLNDEWTPNHTVEDALAAFWTTPDTRRTPTRPCVSPGLAPEVQVCSSSASCNTGHALVAEPWHSRYQPVLDGRAP